ncbi:MAG TPA: glycosyltransferase family 4 protein [Solirubrobacteraceae bacterium]|nr:glycosyltransferase family 4 protein [Solirubrobacteraceae bacterium]
MSELRDEGFGGHLAPAGRHGIASTVQALASGAQPTILHTHFTAFDLAAAGVVRRSDHVIAYWHLHSALRPGAWWRLRNAVKFGLLSRGVAEILCVAPNILNQARSRLAPRERLTLVPNAIDLTRFSPATPQAKEAGRRALGLPSDAKVILHFGWDWERKGGDVLLEAIAMLRARDELDGLMVVTVAERDRVETVARSLGIAEQVRVLAPSDDAPRLYAAADLFAAPSRGEGHPFAVAEALACGLPVVASPIPGHEMIAELAGEACRIAALDPSSLAQALAGCLARSDDEHERAQVAAREWVMREMDIVAWSERMLARYEKALACR